LSIECPSRRATARVADLRRQADQRRRNLGIEPERAGLPAAAWIRVQQYFEVLARGMQDLELGTVAEHLEQRIGRLRERIDQVAGRSDAT
jgi:hypothetical protein